MTNEVSDLSRKRTPKSNGEQDLVRTYKLWSQLGEIFGQSFYREYGAEPPRLWIEAVARLRDDELRDGLLNVMNDNLDFPANLSQFIAACKRSSLSRRSAEKLIENNPARGYMSYQQWKDEQA